MRGSLPAFCAAVLMMSTGGCIVYEDGHEHVHVHHVHSHFCELYVDLYGVDHADILYLESCGIAYADMGPYFFVGFETHWAISIRDIHRWRTEVHLGWTECFARANVSVDLLYVDFPETVQLGPPYGHAYGYRGRRVGEIHLADAEVRDLWQFRVMVGYYGYAPAEVVALGSLDARRFEEHTKSIHSARMKGHAARESPGKPLRYEEHGPSPGKGPEARASSPPAEPGEKGPEAKEKEPSESSGNEKSDVKEHGKTESPEKGKPDAPEKGKKGKPAGGKGGKKPK